jgi:CheY-like chemotaxis protein
MRSESFSCEAEMSAPLLLCVDDELNGLQLRKIILETNGYRVLIAASGAEGLKLFAENPVELVVLDFLMPEMKGDEVADRMRQLKPHVPIVMLSAYYDLPARVDLLVDARIVKGESTQNLLETVARLLESRSSAAGGE